MNLNVVALGRGVREVRENADVSADEARKAIGVSRSTYSRIESDERPLKGAELVLLADHFGVRAAAITGLGAVRERSCTAAGADVANASMSAMHARLCASLELDSYLSSQGIPRA